MFIPRIWPWFHCLFWKGEVKKKRQKRKMENVGEKRTTSGNDTCSIFDVAEKGIMPFIFLLHTFFSGSGSLFGSSLYINVAIPSQYWWTERNKNLKYTWEIRKSHSANKPANTYFISKNRIGIVAFLIGWLNCARTMD